MEHWKCKYCNENLILKNKYTKSGHLAKCKKFKDWKNKYITKEFLIEEYINKEISAIEIANILGFNSSTVINNLLKKYNIPIRNISKSKKLNGSKEKYKNTCLKKYGAEHNLSKNSTSRKKMIDKLYKNEGITNVFQRGSVKEKIKNTGLKKYGVDSPMKVELIKQKVWKSTFKNHGIKYGVLKSHNPIFISKPHKKIIEILKKYNINFKIEQKICNYRVDILIIPNIVIEVYGDYWHANPNKYNSDDILNFPDGFKPEAKEIWKRDKNRIDKIKENNYIIHVVWENDILNTNIEESILCKLKELNLLKK